MSTEFRLKLPNGIDYRNSLLKNGTCCDGYTAVPGASYDSYVSCRDSGWYFVHATGSNACGDQSLGATLSPDNDQTFWYWHYLETSKWPWGKQFTFNGIYESQAISSRFNSYKEIGGLGVTSGVGFTLIGRPQRIPGTNPLSINYWNNPIEEISDYKHPNFLLKNQSWSFNTSNPKEGNLWNTTSNSNNGYAMPGCTGFDFSWEPLPQTGILHDFINNPSVTGEISGYNYDQTDSGDIRRGITYQLLDFLRVKHAHPQSRRILYPRPHDQTLTHSSVGSYWYSLLVDGTTGLGPRNEEQRVSSPWQDNFSVDLSQSLNVYLGKIKDSLGIIIPYVLIDDEHIPFAFYPGSGLPLHIDSIWEDGERYVPDREYPIPGMKGTTGFNGIIPEWPPIGDRPSNWTSGITWWVESEGRAYYYAPINPNGNVIYNIMNDARWNSKGLTAFDGMTLGALFTRRYNDLRTSWIAAFSGTSQATNISNDTIPTSNEIITFFSGWSGQYIRGTTHEIEDGVTGWIPYEHKITGATAVWFPATEWIFNTWPGSNYLKIDGITMYQYNTIWTPYGGGDVRTLSNLGSQATFDNNQEHYLNSRLISRPSIINRSAWAWSLLHVFIPAWECTMEDIYVSQYCYDAYSKNPITGVTGRFSGLTGYSAGITLIRYDSFDLNAEESIYLIRSNAGEVPYRLSGKNTMHCPIGYGAGGGNSTTIVKNTLDRLNNYWPSRLGYVKSATTNLEKYKIYHLAESPVMGLNGITIDPPQSGNSYCLARWPSNQFAGLTGTTFTSAQFNNFLLTKLSIAERHSQLLVFLQFLRGIMRSDPMGHRKLAPMVKPDQTEIIYHLALHGANPITLFDQDTSVLGSIKVENLLSDINSMTGGGRLVPLGRYSGPSGTTWAESGSTGANGNIVKMDQLVLEHSLEDYIMTGAKVVTGPFTGRYIWRITPSPIRAEWSSLPNTNWIIGTIGITADEIRYDLFINHPTRPDYQRNGGIFVIKNNNEAPTIELPSPPSSQSI